jgi:hypothetical protein
MIELLLSFVVALAVAAGFTFLVFSAIAPLVAIGWLIWLCVNVIRNDWRNV